MYKSIPSGIKNISLDPALHKLHKKGQEKSDFGMDNSPELLDGGFGLYSSADLVPGFAPIKTQYFRISLTLSGHADFTIGLEKYRVERNSILFGFPGQIFSLQHRSEDFQAYYMLFSEQFIREIYLRQDKRQQFPFLTYAGVHCFKLNDETAEEIEKIIGKMDTEIKMRQPGCADSIRLYIQLILIQAGRNYSNMLLAKKEVSNSSQSLFNNYIKMVSQHFLAIRRVAEYASMLHVSPDHLNRTIKSVAGKTAGELIDDMIILEAKASLAHTGMSVSEIAYKLEFSDPSNFNKFFKKVSGCTPLQYRNQSE